MSIDLRTLDHWKRMGFNATNVVSTGAVVPDELFDKLLILAKAQCLHEIEMCNEIARRVDDGTTDSEREAARDMAARWSKDRETIQDLLNQCA